MTFRAVCRTGLPGGSSPFRIVDEQDRELEWANRFLDMQCVRGVAPLTLRGYANTLLHFVRWWSKRRGIDIARFDADQFTETTLIDYVRDQRNELPQPGPQNINQRSSMLRRLFRFYFHEEMPHGPYRLPQRTSFQRSPLGYGRGRRAVAADLTLKVPQRVIVPLSAEQVARFWSSFQTARDLALVLSCCSTGYVRAKCSGSDWTICCSAKRRCACAAKARACACSRCLRKPSASCSAG